MLNSVADCHPMKGPIASLMLSPSLAMADAGTPAPKTMAELYPPLPGVEYYCTDSNGDRAELGTVICVTASCQTWMARCEMTATNRMTKWSKVQDGCPAVSLIDRVKTLGNTL